MITLYGWGPLFDCPSPSPYVMKTEIQLQMLGLEFERQFADLESVPKRKAPYVMDGDLLIQDSNFIRAHFEEKLGKSLTEGLSDEEKAASWALERMAEDHLSKMIVSERWLNDANFEKGPSMFFAGVPEPARAGVMKDVREQQAMVMQGSGFTRHSPEERLQLAEWDIQAIRRQLGAKAFLFGSEPSAADASVAAMLISASTEFFDTPLSALVNRHAELTGYIARMKDLYFAESRWPVPEAA
tara:strand:+ start:24775 stop:25500 length:726 start_codon:yes stop_codon:yes gene_type:complete